MWSHLSHRLFLLFGHQNVSFLCNSLSQHFNHQCLDQCRWVIGVHVHFHRSHRLDGLRLAKLLEIQLHQHFDQHRNWLRFRLHTSRCHEFQDKIDSNTNEVLGGFECLHSHQAWSRKSTPVLIGSQQTRPFSLHIFQLSCVVDSLSDHGHQQHCYTSHINYWMDLYFFRTHWFLRLRFLEFHRQS